MSDNYQTRCMGILRSVQFGWNEYDGVRHAQLVGRFEILDGEDAGKFETWFASLSDDVNSKGRSFYEYTIDGLRTCGWTGDDLSELPAVVDAGQCCNEVNLVREHKLGKDDKWRTQVKYVNRVGAAKVDLKANAMTDAEVLDFAKKMKSRIGGASAGNGGGQRSAAPPTNRTAPPPRRDSHPNAPGSSYGGPSPEDDIPFLSCDLAAEPAPIARCIRRF